MQASNSRFPARTCFLLLLCLSAVQAVPQQHDSPGRRRLLIRLVVRTAAAPAAPAQELTRASRCALSALHAGRCPLVEGHARTLTRDRECLMNQHSSSSTTTCSTTAASGSMCKSTVSVQQAQARWQRQPAHSHALMFNTAACLCFQGGTSHASCC